MAKYSTYIELSPNYESVVDIDSEKRHPDMWQEYIVHEDMKKAIEKICDSLKFEDLDKRRSFWLHGTYGTGKTYAAIVIKHLFEDELEKVNDFLSNQMLIPYREKFMSIRRKGDFLVVWKSQTTDIKSGTQLMLVMENAIREKLKAKFGENAYYGKESLVAAAIKAVKDESVNWDFLFSDSEYKLYEDYDSLSEFQNDVAAGDLKAANIVARIYRDKGWGFLNSLKDFKEWLADIIEGNHLEETGIIFLWDEFTAYIRNNPTDDVLQPLSEFCKEQPFFMFLIVHRAPSWLSQLGEEFYEQIVHRYHELEFHITKDAAQELIANSIRVRAGMESQWDTVRNNLWNSISNKTYLFDNLDIKSTQKNLKQLFPLHPMTLTLLATVAQYFGASQRTLFRFMKDIKESEQNVGFIYYINNYGPDDWCWLTPDFLWDYFFTRESDIHDFSQEAKSAYNHYIMKKDDISGGYIMHVFKAVMLLIAVTSSRQVTNLYSRTRRANIGATRNNLYKCFSGQLTKQDIDKYLESLEAISVLRLDNMQNGDIQLQLPYTGNADDFEKTKATIVKENSRYILFKKGGLWATAIESEIWNKNKPSYKRMVIAACEESNRSLENRFNEITQELENNSYKFGILVAVISDSSHFVNMRDRIKTFSDKDKTKRLAIYVLQYPLKDENLSEWYNAKTHSKLAGQDGKSADESRYSEQADNIIAEWTQVAKDNKVIAFYGGESYQSFGVAEMAAKIEKNIIFGIIFTAAPELIISTNTAFKKVQDKVVLDGIKKEYSNSQIRSIAEGLKAIKVWDLEGLDEFAKCEGSDGAEAIAKVSNFILQKFSQGIQIKLDNFWKELQNPPYGYFNSMACGYILGFLMRNYINKEYTWYDEYNNSHILNENTLATMITEMCKENVVNHYLSPGSEIWRKFKPYIQKIFNLDDKESVNETEARKYMAKRCIEDVGLPFWILKYLPTDDFGGINIHKNANEIIDLFWKFLRNYDDQDLVMGNIVNKFTGNGKTRQILNKLYFDKNKVYDALDCFVSQKCPELDKLKNEIGCHKADFNDRLHQVMQGQVSTWVEEDVVGKLAELCIEYKIIAKLNVVLGAHEHCLDKLIERIKNTFDNMKIPGSVIETMKYNWIPGLKAMHKMSIIPWSKIEAKDEVAKELELYAQSAWSNTLDSKSILKEYLKSNRQNCTDEELNGIFNKLGEFKYDHNASLFVKKIEELLDEVSYNRNKKLAEEIWKQKSGFNTVQEWCNAYSVPIQWVVSDSEQEHLNTLKTIQDGKLVDNFELNNAIQYFKTHALNNLKDKAYIQNCFIKVIGESYRFAFQEYGNTIINRLKTNEELTTDVYNWSNKPDVIRNTIDSFLQPKLREKAENNVMSMSVDELRSKVLELLEKNPSLYQTFI